MTHYHQPNSCAHTYNMKLKRENQKSVAHWFCEAANSLLCAKANIKWSHNVVTVNRFRPWWHIALVVGSVCSWVHWSVIVGVNKLCLGQASGTNLDSWSAYWSTPSFCSIQAGIVLQSFPEYLMQIFVISTLTRRCLNWSTLCSMQAGQCNTRTLLLRNHTIVINAVRGLALSW